MVDWVMMVEVHNGMSEGGGHVWDVHAADEIAHKKFHEPVTFVFRGRRGDSLWCDTGGGVGGGVVGGVINTALVVVSRGDHGGAGSKMSRR